MILRRRYRANNVGKVERAASIVAGSLLFLRGLRTKGWLGTGAALLGIAFMRRGLTGFSYTYQALGISSVFGSSESGARVDEAITINLPRDEVYRFWRDPANLVSVLEHVEGVQWDAELIEEQENQLIAWRSPDGSRLPHSGCVCFADAAGGRGTEVRIQLSCDPASFESDPSCWIRHELKRLKARIEAGVLPETEGQPAGAHRAEVPERAEPDIVATASEESFPASDAPAYIH